MELIVFALAVGALVAIDRASLAIGFASIVIVNLGLMRLRPQR